MRRLVAISGVLVTVLSLAMGAALVIGQGQPPSEQVERLHLTDCALPCWNGIRPGASSRSDAEQRIGVTFPDFKALGSGNLPFMSWVLDDSVIDVAVDDGFVHSMGIGTNFPMREMPSMGEVLAVFGSPTCVGMDDSTHVSTLYYENAAHQVILQFSVSQLSLSNPVNNFSIGLNYNLNCQKRLALSWSEFRASRYGFRFTS